MRPDSVLFITALVRGGFKRPRDIRILRKKRLRGCPDLDLNPN